MLINGIFSFTNFASQENMTPRKFFKDTCLIKIIVNHLTNIASRFSTLDTSIKSKLLRGRYTLAIRG